MEGPRASAGAVPRWRVRRGGAVLLAGLVLVALVGLLLFDSYRSAARVRRLVLTQHQQSFRLHVEALGHLLESSQEDLRNLADSSEVAAFFENRDLGMSMQYGLGLSLIPIRERLRALVAGGGPGREARFVRVALEDADGTVLAAAGEAPAPGGESRAPPRAPDRAADATGAQLSPEGHYLVVTHGHRFKDRPAGRLVGWLRPAQVGEALSGGLGAHEEVSRLVVLDAAGQAYEPRKGGPLPPGLDALPTDGRLVEAEEARSEEPLLLQRIPVPHQPLSLVDVDRAADLLGRGSPLAGVLALSLVAVLVLGAVAVAAWLASRSLALQIRLDEAQRREAAVAEKHEALQRVDQERRRLWQAVNQSPATVIIADHMGRIEFVNPAFERVTGYTALEAIGNPRMLLSSRQVGGGDQAAIWASLRRGGTWHGEVQNRRADGTPLWMAVSISPALDEQGRVTHFTAIGEDVTARRQASQELERARDAAEAASRAKSAFLANMSHEIRTPLNAILGYSQLLTRDAALSAPSRRSVETINRAGEHLLALLNQVLEISKIEAGRATVVRTAFDLRGLLADLAALFDLKARAKGLAFEVVPPREGPATLVGDEGKLRQVLVNLLGNAVKFTERGLVRLTVEVRCGAEGGHTLWAQVADTGPGIAPAELGRLFQEFEQAAAGRASQSGTGLGLAISRSFTRLMGGDLAVASEPGQGATFTMSVPVEAGPAAAPVRQAGRVVGLEGPGPAPRLLVVDDEATNRDWLAAILTAIGFEVREADDGAPAVEACQAGWPGLVLMDLRMPGMDGGEATRRIRALPGPRVPVVALTASALDADRTALLADGADAVLAKPVREEELLEVLRVRLGLAYRREVSAPDQASAAAAAAAAVPLTPAALAVLPAPVRQAMRDATLRGDIDRLHALIDEAAPALAGAAEGLRALAGRYDYDGLQRALA